MKQETKDELRGFIQGGLIDRAIEMVRSAHNYDEGEEFVFIVLREEKSTPELVETVLEVFLGTKPDRAGIRNYGGGHGGWVHSLSHFTRVLWERRMDGWIKKFYEVSFKGANELGDSMCSDRLVGEFGIYAKYDDDPTAFACTLENLRWMEWEYFTYAKARIEAGRFESEEAFLRWKLQRHAMLTTFDNEAQAYLVDLDEIRSMVQRLQELGTDTSEFNGLERDLLTERLSVLEAKFSTATGDWFRESLEKAIQKTRSALA